MIPLVFTLVFSSIVAGFCKVMEVTQPAFIVAKTQEAARFVCEYNNAGDATDLRIALLKQIGNESIEICATSFTAEYESFSMKDVRVQVDTSHESVNVTLFGLQTTDAGLYVCRMERIFPPPYYPVKGKGTQLYVIDKDPCPDSCPDMHLFLWIIISVFSGLLGYSIVLTTYILRKAKRKRAYYAPGIYEKFISL
ncbi:cytotoxic T-lymphocyte protein 4 [Elgaria multicarinata webbii]|uniref:cytotoxic T-lymphocyte protein 4 n=1 Tax=Elgaria multicarinata webbii TaxID=159646 RepID=UPI002FCD45E2